MNNFETGRHESIPPEIKELIDQYGGIRNIPVERQYHTSDGWQVKTLTVEQWMVAFCPEDPDSVSDEKFEKNAIKFLLGQEHDQEET